MKGVFKVVSGFRFHVSGCCSVGNGVERIFDLDDKLLLNWVFIVEVEPGITAYFPDKFERIDALDGRFVDEFDVSNRIIEVGQKFDEM